MTFITVITATCLQQQFGIMPTACKIERYDKQRRQKFDTKLQTETSHLRPTHAIACTLMAEQWYDRAVGGQNSPFGFAR